MLAYCSPIEKLGLRGESDRCKQNVNKHLLDESAAYFGLQYMHKNMLFVYINRIVKPRSTSEAVLGLQYGPNPYVGRIDGRGRPLLCFLFKYTLYIYYVHYITHIHYIPDTYPTYTTYPTLHTYTTYNTYLYIHYIQYTLNILNYIH